MKRSAKSSRAHNKLDVPIGSNYNNCMLNMIEYKDILDIEWALRSAELRAKSEWDKMLIYKDTESLLYDLHYEKVKELRDAQKMLRNIYKVIRNHSDIEVKHSA